MTFLSHSVMEKAIEKVRDTYKWIRGFSLMFLLQLDHFEIKPGVVIT